MLLQEALKGTKRENVVLSVKYGGQRDPKGNFIGFAPGPVATKTALAYSLKRLGTDYVDIYRPARVSPLVPIEDTIGAIADLVKEGYVRHIGLSEAGADNIRRAQTVHPIVDLQIEYAMITRTLERKILPTLRELGIGVTAYGVLSRGLISESALSGGSFTGFRAHSPRFQGENLDKNLSLVRALKAIADENGCTVVQLAIAWVAGRGEDIVPLVGARKRERLAEALGALDITLSPEELKRIDAASPRRAPSSTRWAERWLKSVMAPLSKITADKKTPAAKRLKVWVRTLVDIKRKKVLEDPELFAVYKSITDSAHAVVAKHVKHLHDEIAEILRDGVREGAWRVSDADKSAAIILSATSRFHHPAMVALDEGKTDLKQLDALTDLLVAGLSSD